MTTTNRDKNQLRSLKSLEENSLEWDAVVARLLSREDRSPHSVELLELAVKGAIPGPLNLLRNCLLSQLLHSLGIIRAQRVSLLLAAWALSHVFGCFFIPFTCVLDLDFLWLLRKAACPAPHFLCASSHFIKSLRERKNNFYSLFFIVWF